MAHLFEHTADVGIAAEGTDLGAALADAANGLAQIVCGALPSKATEPITFRLEAPDEESLVVAFLSELLWILEERGVLWVHGGASVEAGGTGWIVTADGNGTRFDPKLHGEGTEVKAITYHALTIERGEQVRIRVIVDI